jgi:hypothetical protein
LALPQNPLKWEPLRVVEFPKNKTKYFLELKSIVMEGQGVEGAGFGAIGNVSVRTVPKSSHHGIEDQGRSPFHWIFAQSRKPAELDGPGYQYALDLLRRKQSDSDKRDEN